MDTFPYHRGYTISAPPNPFDSQRLSYSESAPYVGYASSYTAQAYPAPTSCGYAPEKLAYSCEGYRKYNSREDIKPMLLPMTSAFNIAPSIPPYSTMSSGDMDTAVAVETTMAGPGFHSSPYSAFSPFPSDHSPPMEANTPQTHSPLL